MDQIDLERLKEAVQLLESPSWTAKIADIIGMPIEWAIKKLPEGAGEIVSKATEIAIRKTLVASIATMDRKYSGKPFRGWHKLAAVTSGGIGGFFGLPGLVIELPISTVIMLRSIADIARGEGEKIEDIETQMACIEVFGFGGRKRGDDASETGYYGVRIGLATTLREAAQYITERGLVEEGAPAIVRLIARIASRYSVPVIDKIAAQGAPILGLAGGATINYLFINHFQSMARGHFIVRNLERKWGEDAIRAEYQNVAKPYNV